MAMTKKQNNNKKRTKDNTEKKIATKEKEKERQIKNKKNSPTLSYHERRVACGEDENDARQKEDHLHLFRHVQRPSLAALADVLGHAAHAQQHDHDGDVAHGRGGDDEQSDAGVEEGEDPVHGAVAVEVKEAPGTRVERHVPPDLREELNLSVDG